MHSLASPHNNGILSRCTTVESNLTSSVTCLCRHDRVTDTTIMYSERHKHVTDVKLDSTVMYLDRIPLLWGLFVSEESNCTSIIKRVHIFTDRIV